MIIAECGINWKGGLEIAERLIREASKNGADLAKFQLYETEAIHPVGSQYYNISKKHELTFEQAKWLFNLGKQNGIEVFFSVFDTERVDWCRKIGVGIYKVAYSQRQNVELINYIIAHAGGAGIFISTDSPIHPNWDARYLYCVPQYPAKLTDISFEHLGSYAGFSDHTIGLDASKIALARGAKIIEKHFCLSREGQDDNPDIMGSMTPPELRELKEWEGRVSLVA